MKIKALIVEDDEILLKNLKRFLELEGIDADTATNGLEALEVIQQCEVLHDVVITDLNMPQMGGMQLVNALQSQSRTQDIPIIVITAFGQKQNLLTALRSGVKDLLEKPWGADDLMASIHRVIPAPGSEPVLSDNYANQLYDYLFNVGSAGLLPSILFLRFSFSGQVKTLAGSMRPALLSTMETVLQEVFPGDQWVFNKDDFSVAVFDCEGGSGELNIDSKAKLKALQSRIARLFLKSVPEHQLAVFAPLVAAIFVDKGILTAHQGAERSAVVERLESIVGAAKFGKGRVFRYTDDSISLLPLLRLDIPSLINRAIQATSPEFFIVWQPQINLADGSLYGAEALARWNSPELGLVNPDKFISVAEDWGLMDKLGTLLRDIAMKEFLVMQSLEVALPRMSFNVSPFELVYPSFGEDLLERVRSHGIPFELVTAEITESASVLDSEDGMRNLRILRDSGIGLAIDDFGSGYTSLGALSEQPFTELKIDRSYLEGIVDNPKLLAVVSNMVALAEDLDAISVVEGIEDKEQLDILRALGCTYGQGYYWSKPIPMADLGVLLQSPGDQRI